jgi:hypothetical protein
MCLPGGPLNNNPEGVFKSKCSNASGCFNGNNNKSSNIVIAGLFCIVVNEISSDGEIIFSSCIINNVFRVI